MKLFFTLFFTFVLSLVSVARAENLKKITIDATRLVLFRGEVNEELANSVINALDTFDEADKTSPIYMVINSPGGSVPDGGRILAAMEATEAPIICVVDEKAYSMAAFVTEWCDKRYIQKYADMLFHEASYSLRGSESEMDSEIVHVKQYLEVFHRDLAFRLKLDYATYKAKIRNNWWLTAQKAVDAGAADGTVEALRYQFTAPPKNNFSFFGVKKRSVPVHEVNF